MEVQMHWFAIYGDFTSAHFYITDSSTLFSFTIAPSSTTVVQNGLSLPHWDLPPNIEQVDSVKLDILIGIGLDSPRHRICCFVRLHLCELAEVSFQMMLEIWVLLHRMEQRDLMIFLRGQGSKRVVSVLVIESNLFLCLNEEVVVHWVLETPL